MNLMWIKQINDLKIQKQTELNEYNNNRNYPLILAIEQSNLVKQQAILNAKAALYDVFNGTLKIKI